MAVQIRYMGAKHNLAPSVAHILAGLPPGPCLDLFCGMCSVAGALADTGRRVWCNDVQRYAALVAKVLITSRQSPPSKVNARGHLFESFARNQRSLAERFTREIKEESSALEQGDYYCYQELTRTWLHAGNNDTIAAETLALQRGALLFPYRLCTLSFAYGYFGLQQAIDLDSVKYAIDLSVKDASIDTEVADWYHVALLQTASTLAAAPGHFAEYLHVRDVATYVRMRPLRRRCVWTTFCQVLDRLMPYGAPVWRSGNRVFCEEGAGLLKKIFRRGLRPRIIYADPPYSRAQYSRYYHLLETLTCYDYPTVNGAGRYREGRFQTLFSNAGSVVDAFYDLVETSALLEADLVVSYPSNGLLFELDADVIDILEDSYRHVKVFNVDHTHSTLGGAPGRQRSDVEELIFVARTART